MAGRIPVEIRFWRYAEEGDSNACWIWQGGTINRGYGQIRRMKNGKWSMVLAHRLSYEIHIGPIPDRMLVLHTCPDGDNPSCVNPNHLRLGTHKDNAQDLRERGPSTVPGRTPRGPQPKKLTHVLFIRCHGGLKVLLEEECIKDGTPVSDVVRRILYDYFANRADCAE